MKLSICTGKNIYISKFFKINMKTLTHNRENYVALKILESNVRY